VLTVYPIRRKTVWY